VTLAGALAAQPGVAGVSGGLLGLDRSPADSGHAGGSLAGNDSMEASSTQSIAGFCGSVTGISVRAYRTSCYVSGR
jgi:hypothetical protein